jgi:hypothetical protein
MGNRNKRLVFISFIAVTLFLLKEIFCVYTAFFNPNTYPPLKLSIETFFILMVSPLHAFPNVRKVVFVIKSNLRVIPTKLNWLPYEQTQYFEMIFAYFNLTLLIRGFTFEDCRRLWFCNNKDNLLCEVWGCEVHPCRMWSQETATQSQHWLFNM